MTDSNIPERMISEHDVIRVMPGDIGSVRRCLVIALEQLGYRVLSENPLKAKHAARGGGKYLMSANALDYPTRLEINLKPRGQGATQLIFDYQVQHGGFGDGDRQSLTREAEAIIALAKQHTEVRHCPGCGIEVMADSRFCRKCGAPVVTSVPAELEVMRLTAGARAGYQWAWVGIAAILFGSLFPLAGLVKGTPLGFLFGIAVIFAALGAWGLGAGLRRLHLTLNPKTETEELRFPKFTSTLIAAHVTDELPIQYSSITEGTTNLLPEIPASDSCEKIPS